MGRGEVDALTQTAPRCPEHTESGPCRACAGDHKAGEHTYPGVPGCPACERLAARLAAIPTAPWEYR